MTELIYLSVLFVIIELLGLAILFLRSQLKKERSHYIINFPSYKVILDYFVERAYDIIHKDKMLIYSIEATRVSDDEFKEYAKEFARLVITLMGPMLQEEFAELYGNEDTFLTNIMEFFSTKYEDDEIRKSAVEELMTEETTEETK